MKGESCRVQSKPSILFKVAASTMILFVAKRGQTSLDSKTSSFRTAKFCSLTILPPFLSDKGLRALPRSNYQTPSVLKVANNTRKAF